MNVTGQITTKTPLGLRYRTLSLPCLYLFSPRRTAPSIWVQFCLFFKTDIMHRHSSVTGCLPSTPFMTLDCDFLNDVWLLKTSEVFLSWAWFLKTETETSSKLRNSGGWLRPGALLQGRRYQSLTRQKTEQIKKQKVLSCGKTSVVGWI